MTSKLFHPLQNGIASLNNLTSQVLEGSTQHIKEGLQSFNNVTKSIVTHLVEPQLANLGNMTSQMMEQQHNQTQQTFNKFIKV